MTTAAQYGEPWRVTDRWIMSAQSRVIAESGSIDDRPDLFRLVACVNTLAVIQSDHVIVPRIATRYMRVEGYMAHYRFNFDTPYLADAFKDVWSAMLAAAPKAPP